jgi:hypothetical protein
MNVGMRTGKTESSWWWIAFTGTEIPGYNNIIHVIFVCNDKSTSYGFKLEAVLAKDAKCMHLMITGVKTILLGTEEIRQFWSI